MMRSDKLSDRDSELMFTVHRVREARKKSAERHVFSRVKKGKNKGKLSDVLETATGVTEDVFIATLN